MLQTVATIELVVCWVAWAMAFVNVRRKAAGHRKVVRARASWWGIVLEGIGFFCVMFHIHPAGFHKSTPSLIASMLLAPPSTALAWAATRHLGKQWRYEAALSEDHDLIQTGPYALVRNPIYASMLGMLLAAATCFTWWPMVIPALIFFIAGTEIRVHAEEGLLAERFGDTFTAYRTRVPAYIPFLR